MKLSNRKNQVLVILAALVLLFAAAALAQGPGGGSGRGPGHGGGPEHRLEMLTEKLELTPEQSATVGQIMENSRELGVGLHKEMMRLQNELEGEMLKDEPSQKTALGLVKEIGDLRTETQSLRMQSRLEIRDELTAEQRDKMLMMKGRSGNGHGRKGGPGNRGRSGSRCDRSCGREGPGRGAPDSQDAN
jgi:Spy/CpxP family protein refolding chaperone